LYRGESRITILFIYLPIRVFCCRIFGSVGGCRQLFSFQFLWESASYIRVSASVGVITTQFLYYFYYSCQLIGVVSRSICVGLIGYFSLPEFLTTTAILQRYCRLFSDIPGTKWCIINLFIPLAIFERGGGDAARAPTVAAAYLFLSISSLPASQGEWECRKARFQVLLVAPLYFHVSGSYVEIAASDAC
jgi:hypothetical protein